MLHPLLSISYFSNFLNKYPGSNGTKLFVGDLMQVVLTLLLHIDRFLAKPVIGKAKFYAHYIRFHPCAR